MKTLIFILAMFAGAVNAQAVVVPEGVTLPKHIGTDPRTGMYYFDMGTAYPWLCGRLGADKVRCDTPSEDSDELLRYLCDFHNPPVYFSNCKLITE